MLHWKCIKAIHFAACDWEPHVKSLDLAVCRRLEKRSLTYFFRRSVCGTEIPTVKNDVVFYWKMGSIRKIQLAGQALERSVAFVQRLRTQRIALLLSTLLFLFPCTQGQAQVAVYEIEFEREDRSINFSFFDGGYFVMDGLTGVGSFVFTFQQADNLTGQIENVLVSSEDSAEAFTAVKRSTRKVVVRATAETTTGLSHYLAIGELDETLSVSLRGQKLRFEVAPTLRGYVLASDDESDVEFSDETETLGFAGMASMKLSLMRQRSVEANRLNQTSSDVVSALISELEQTGFVVEGADDESSDDSVTDDGSTSTGGS